MSTNWLLLENRLRATPLNLLEQGLTTENWECISVAYTMLTGKAAPRRDTEYPIKPEPEQLLNPNTMEVSEIGSDKQIPPSEAEAEEEDDGEEKPKKKKNLLDRVSKVNVRGEVNKFVDDGLAAAEDMAFLPKQPLSEALLRQRRPEYKKITVVCSKCSKKERVDPMLAPKKLDRTYKMRYVCNDCSCGG